MSLDRDGCIDEINLSGADLLGTVRGKLKRLRFMRFIEPPQYQEFDRFCGRLFETGRREEIVLRLCPPSKPVVTALLSGIAPGDLESCQVAVTDISRGWRRSNGGNG